MLYDIFGLIVKAVNPKAPHRTHTHTTNTHPNKWAPVHSFFVFSWSRENHIKISWNSLCLPQRHGAVWRTKSKPFSPHLSDHACINTPEQQLGGQTAARGPLLSALIFDFCSGLQDGDKPRAALCFYCWRCQRFSKRNTEVRWNF